MGGLLLQPICTVAPQKLPGSWQVRTGNNSVQGGGHSHTYCKLPETLEQKRHGVARGLQQEVPSRVGAGTHTGQATGQPIPKASANTLVRGCPQSRVRVEPLSPCPMDCSGLVG